MKYTTKIILAFILFQTLFVVENLYPIQKYEALTNDSIQDSCILAGLNFKIVNDKSERSYQAVIDNNKILIMHNGVQYMKYRIAYYVFSAYDNYRTPVIRICNEKIASRILKIIKYSRPGDRFLFEDIIMIDASGIRLNNEVRPITIERTE